MRQLKVITVLLIVALYSYALIFNIDLNLWFIALTTVAIMWLAYKEFVVISKMETITEF